MVKLLKNISGIAPSLPFFKPLVNWWCVMHTSDSPTQGIQHCPAGILFSSDRAWSCTAIFWYNIICQLFRVQPAHLLMTCHIFYIQGPDCNSGPQPGHRRSPAHVKAWASAAESYESVREVQSMHIRTVVL